MSFDMPTVGDHARKRMQQRGISMRDLELLFELGRRKKQNGGAIVYLDRTGRAQLKESSERLSRLYAVLNRSESTVVTVGWRTRNLKLH